MDFQLCSVGPIDFQIDTLFLYLVTYTDSIYLRFSPISLAYCRMWLWVFDDQTIQKYFYIYPTFCPRLPTVEKILTKQFIKQKRNRFIVTIGHIIHKLWYEDTIASEKDQVTKKKVRKKSIVITSCSCFI